MKAPKQPAPEFNIQSILNNPVDSRALKSFIDNAILSKQKIQMENEQLALVRGDVKEQLGVPPAIFNQLVKIKFNESLKQEREKAEIVDTTLVELYGEDLGPTADFDASNEDINDE